MLLTRDILPIIQIVIIFIVHIIYTHIYNYIYIQHRKGYIFNINYDMYICYHGESCKFCNYISEKVLN